MKIQRKPSSISLPVWMDAAVRDLAEKHNRSMSGEIEFLIEEAIKNNANNSGLSDPTYVMPGTGPLMAEAANG